MLLGLGGADDGIDPTALATGAGVEAGELLVRFVDAIAAGDELGDLRDEVRSVVGESGLVDAAAVVANFYMMTRIADGTGTPLDEFSHAMSSELRSELALDDLISARPPV